MSPHVLRIARAAALAALMLLSVRPATAETEEEKSAYRVRAQAETPTQMIGTQITADGSAVVNFGDLARIERLGLREVPPVRPRPRRTVNRPQREQAEVETGFTPEALYTPPPFIPFVASPSPSQSFIGLDDIPMVDSSYIIIPPDVNGAVGPSRILQPLNNNIRVLEKSNGAVVTTVGVNTFWAPTGGSPNNYTDPRTIYDPYTGRFIMIMQGDLDQPTGNSLVIGISDTSDPIGTWHLYRTILFQNATSALYDFPTLGFNKNWITVSINRFNSAGGFQGNAVITIHYPSLLANTFTAFRFNRADFCAAPVQTYSATSDTEYVMVHLSSAGATFRLDRITGTGPAAPTYTASGTLTRTGGGWTQSGGQSLPQSAPNAGASACGATPCPIELIDSQIRTPPVFRNGNIWYTQTIGLPSGGAFTRSAAQWTRITTPGGGFVEGGRVEDPTATATNGGKWYAYPQIAVNANLDFVVGYSQFSSAQHPAAGYSVKLAGDAAGTIRDAAIAKAGDDYYHKDFGSARNRWGDYSVAQVDPSDDMTLWWSEEYAKTRVGTDDGTSGANSSRWSSWWASLAPPTVTIDPGPSLAEGNAGNTPFNFTVRLLSVYGLPITVSYQTSDGSATTADNDYVPATSTVVIPAGSLSAPLTVNVVGDTQCEGAETFHVTLTATSGAGITPGSIPIGSPSAATATILNDETARTITASAGPGGTISPPGVTVVPCFGNQTYTIAPADKCHAIADVLVDGVSVGAVSTYTFTNVTTNHTIAASFTTLGPFTIAASAGSGGSIAPAGAVSVACGANQTFTIAADPCFAIADVLVDGVSVGAVATYTFTDVQANHTISASFATLGPFTITATAGAGGSIAPAGAVSVACGANQTFTITPDPCFAIADVLVDGVSVGAVATYTFTNVTTNHTIAASFTTLGPFTITATAGAGGSIAPAGAVSVACGANQTFTVTADPCFAIADVLVDGVSVGAVATYTFTNVQANHTIAASFATLGPFTITATVGAGGSIVPAGTVSVACGANQTFTIIPADKCQVIADVLVDGVSVGAVGTYTFTNVTTNHTIAASFSTLGPFTITATAGAGGSIAPAGAVSVACGANQTFHVTADPCFAIADVKVDGVSVGTVASYTFTDVQAPRTIDATFAPTGLTLSATHVDVSCTGASDGSIDLTVTGGVPPYSYAWSNGASTEDLFGLAAGSYTVIVTDAAGCTASLKVTVGVTPYTITATAGPNGSIAPSGSVSVACGTSASFTITPDPGYTIDQLVVDGNPIIPTLSYTFSNVVANHTISVTFKIGVTSVHERPTSFVLSPVHPNPTTGAIRLDFGLPTAGATELTVLDLQGREIAVLARGQFEAGWHSARWNGLSAVREVSAGVYFVRLTAGGKKIMRKFAVTR